MQNRTIKEWNENYDCGFISVPKDLDVKKALVTELRINYGVTEVDKLIFVVDIQNKKNLKEDLFNLSSKYKQDKVAFFEKGILINLNFDKKVAISHGFSSLSHAMLAGKIIKDGINRLK